jgi:hypothetical protein
MNYGSETANAYDSAPVPAKQSPAAAAMDGLDHELNALHQAIDVLEKRIEPMLAPPGPEAAGETRPKDGAASPHVSQLFNFLAGFRAARQKVERLTRRTEF